MRAILFRNHSLYTQRVELIPYAAFFNGSQSTDYKQHQILVSLSHPGVYPILSTQELTQQLN